MQVCALDCHLLNESRAPLISLPKMSFYYNEKRGSLSFSYRNSKSASDEEYCLTNTCTLDNHSLNIPNQATKTFSDQHSEPSTASKTTDLNNNYESLPSKNDFIPAIAVEDDKNVESDSITGYTILASMILFIALHIMPVLEKFTALLQLKMGSFVSIIVLIGISGWSGNYLAQSRKQQYQTYCEIVSHKSFKGCRSLFFLCMALYILSFVVSWVFNFLFSVYDRVPILGSLVVMGTILWVSTILIFLMCYCLGSFTWSITSTAFNLLMGPSIDSDSASEQSTNIRKRRSRHRISY